MNSAPSLNQHSLSVLYEMVIWASANKAVRARAIVDFILSNNITIIYYSPILIFFLPSLSQQSYSISIKGLLSNRSVFLINLVLEINPSPPLNHFNRHTHRPLNVLYQNLGGPLPHLLDDPTMRPQNHTFLNIVLHIKLHIDPELTIKLWHPCNHLDSHLVWHLFEKLLHDCLLECLLRPLHGTLLTDHAWVETPWALL